MDRSASRQTTACSLFQCMAAERMDMFSFTMWPLIHSTPPLVPILKNKTWMVPPQPQLLFIPCVEPRWQQDLPVVTLARAVYLRVIHTSDYSVTSTCQLEGLYGLDFFPTYHSWPAQCPTQTFSAACSSCPAPQYCTASNATF